LPASASKNAQGQRDEGLIAPRWHTSALIFSILFVATTGTLLGHGPVTPAGLTTASSRIAGMYLPMLLMQWGLMAYIGYVGRAARARNVILDLLGKRWGSPARAFVDIALAAVAGALIVGSELAWAKGFGAARSASVASLLPTNAAERIVWAAVAMSVGFCEEVVYRGYLQSQLRAFTGSIALAIVVQAALFGVAHGDQGAVAMLRFALYGLALGALAHARRSLVPGIICHVGIDLMAGLIAG
jgi:membrane protease YdiL (CAAX protease family)